MTIYITKGRHDGRHFTAILFGGKVYKLDYEEGADDNDAIVSAVRFVIQKIKDGVDPRIYKEQLYIQQDVVQDYDENFRSVRSELNETYGYCVTISNYNGISERLRMCAVGDDNWYKFRQGDIIIAERKRGANETTQSAERNKHDFSICARVVSADRSHDVLVLDKYMLFGEVNCSGGELPLMEMELYGFYRPMTIAETELFRDGLLSLLSDRRKFMALNEPDIAKETCRIVSELTSGRKCPHKATD